MSHGGDDSKRMNEIPDNELTLQLQLWEQGRKH